MSLGEMVNRLLKPEIQIIEASSQGGEWAYTALVYLTDGTRPLHSGGVVIGAGGILYGSTFDFPNSDGEPAGSIFSLTPPASPVGAWAYAQLYTFTYGDPGSQDGSQPQTRLVIGPGGVLYGVTPYGGLNDTFDGSGTIFSLTPPQSPGGAWTESILYRFTAGTDGYYPGCPVLSKQGLFYGVSDDGRSGSRKTGHTLTRSCS